ncbi:ribosomal L28e protein [Oesophagostomum dentatum]|uniref:Large ribosomal subunit protein eL28 n=1 Tax=Oesophagostomum dentatum TaxID=61180 RepID=A0A0B1TCP9_OESDE|nr:ribosomal L28e protein [Oesophagostomum dentatum]
MSADLTWQIIRKNSCFLRRQRGIQKHFSVEPFNLRGLNSPRFNGLISKKAMDIAPAKDGKGVVVSLKVPGKAARPAKSTSTVVLRNRDKTLKSVKAIAKSQGLTPYYKLAQRRAAAIIRSQQPKTKKHAKKIEA